MLRPGIPNWTSTRQKLWLISAAPHAAPGRLARSSTAARRRRSSIAPHVVGDGAPEPHAAAATEQLLRQQLAHDLATDDASNFQGSADNASIETGHSQQQQQLAACHQEASPKTMGHSGSSISSSSDDLSSDTGNGANAGAGLPAQESAPAAAIPSTDWFQQTEQEQQQQQAAAELQLLQIEQLQGQQAAGPGGDATAYNQQQQQQHEDEGAADGSIPDEPQQDDNGKEETAVKLPPAPAIQAAMEAEKAAALAELAQQHPHLGEAALLNYYKQGKFRSGQLQHDGPRTRGYRWDPFLGNYPVPRGFAFNYNSFMGSYDPLDGKYYVPPQLLGTFLSEMHEAMGRRGIKLCLSENYNKRAYRHFQELDFDWSMPIEVVLDLIPRIAAIVAEEAARAHDLEQVPTPIISMRTHYKVHLNFPSIITSEGRARRARKAVINRCRAELAGLPPLGLLRDEVGTRQALRKAEEELEQLVAEEARLRAMAAEAASGKPVGAKAGAKARAKTGAGARAGVGAGADAVAGAGADAAAGAGACAGVGAGADAAAGAGAESWVAAAAGEAAVAVAGAEPGDAAGAPTDTGRPAMAEAAVVGGAVVVEAAAGEGAGVLTSEVQRCGGGEQQSSGSAASSSTSELPVSSSDAGERTAYGSSQQPVNSSGTGQTGTSSSSSSVASRGTADAAAAVACQALHPLRTDLDWEAVVDVPHGSLRLPGCYKAPWMDRDPEWVEAKCYSVVEWRSHDESTHVSPEMLHDDSAHEPSTAPQLTQPSSSPSQPKGEWHKVPLTLQLLKACSIHPTPEQMVEYEQSPAFLQDAFEDMERKRQANALRNSVKQKRKALKALRQQLGLEPEPSKTSAVAAAAPNAAPGSDAASPSGPQQQRQQQQKKQTLESLAEAAAAALQEQQQRAEEKRRKEAELAEKRRRAEELMQQVSSRLAAAAPAPAGPIKPQLKSPARLGVPQAARPQPPRDLQQQQQQPQPPKQQH